jgi:hypothetical protein
MIDSAEPLSLVIWAVFAFAAGLYPLGFMLGAPCSPCCGGDEEWFDFNRCIRFVNVDTSAPRTSYSTSETVDTPLHGFSRTVSRPEEVGARRVATKLTLPFSFVVDSSAMALSDGETRTGVYALKYNAPDGQQDAVQWTVTLQGVTMPLTPPTSAISFQVQSTSGQYEFSYEIGAGWTSANAPRSVSVYSAEVLFTDSDGVPSFGSQFLDGLVVTEAALKSMLSAEITSGNDLQATLRFTPSQQVFRYVPQGSNVRLRYVIEHARGNTRRYRVLTVRVLQGGTPDPVPPGGLTPPSFSPPDYADTPTPSPVPPAFAGDAPLAKTATVYSTSADQTIECPPVEISPTGQLLRTEDYSKAVVTSAEHLTILQPSAFVYGSALEYGWIMRPYDPFYGTYSFNYPAYSTLNAWIYDTERVADWLNGEGTVPYNSGQLISPTDSSWTMQVSDPVAFCGYPLCTPIGFLGGAPTGFLGGAMYGGIVSNTMTVQTAKFPSTYTSTNEKGTTTYTNPCYGLDAAPVVTARLLPSGCQYSGSYSSCENPSSLNNAWVRNRGQPVRVFYCGDLLWAIEHGPCRNTLTIPYLNWGNETYTIGGNDSDPSQNNRRCHVSFTQNEGVCMPYEATLTLNQQYQIRCYAGASLYIGDALTGDIVCSAVGSSGAGYLTASGGCTSQVFSGVIPFQQAPGRTEYGGMLPLTIVRKRDKWCDEWANNVELWFSTGCFCGLVPGSCAATVPSGSPFFAVIDASVAFGASTSPLPNTASVSTASLPKQGGTVTLTYCCPERQETRVIGPHSGRYPRSFNIESSGSGLPGSGITAYVTQAGYDGVECPFTVMWLSGSVISLGSKSRAFAATGEPIMGQINHSEQPGCPWSVVESANWIVAEQTVDGLLKVSINGNVAAVYGPSDSKYTHPYREATVTISSGGSTDTWEIVQFQP